MTDSRPERMASAVSHGIGLVLAMAACVLLIQKASSLGSPLHLAVYTLFGSCLILLYLSSTLTHVAQIDEPNAVFQIMDYGSIFVMIAATFTVLIAVAVRNTVGWMVLRFEWSAAVAGIVIKALTTPKFDKKADPASSALYFAMLIPLLIVLPYVSPLVASRGIFWLTAGVAIFLFGSLFFFWKLFKYHHLLWHILTILASASHVYFVYVFLSKIRI